MTARTDHVPDHIETQGAMRQPGEWFACEHPEQPWNDLARMHDCCTPCWIGGSGARLMYSTGLSETVAPTRAELDAAQARIDTYGEAPRWFPRG